MHNKLTQTKVNGYIKAGVSKYHGDGGNLWLTTEASWAFKFTSPVTGKTRQMGLGSATTFSLAEVRELAREARKLVAQGIDPIEQKNASRLVVANVITFREVADKLFDEHSKRKGWSSKYRTLWRATMRDYCSQQSATCR